MTRFPYTRMQLARLFINLAVLAIPENETKCRSDAWLLSVLLRVRVRTIRIKGADWKADDD